jgi:hypothetical protein
MVNSHEQNSEMDLALKSDTAAFVKEMATFEAALEAAVAEGINTQSVLYCRDVLIFTRTPLILQVLDINCEPLYVSGDIFCDIVKGVHPDITFKALKGLPKALTEPVKICDATKDENNKATGDFLLLVELEGKQSATLLVGVALDTERHLFCGMCVMEKAYFNKNGKRKFTLKK